LEQVVPFRPFLREEVSKLGSAVENEIEASKCSFFTTAANVPTEIGIVKKARMLLTKLRFI
jgi:hypothetical protein